MSQFEQFLSMGGYAVAVSWLGVIAFFVFVAARRPGYLGEWGRRIKYTAKHSKLPD